MGKTECASLHACLVAGVACALYIRKICVYPVPLTSVRDVCVTGEWSGSWAWSGAQLRAVSPCLRSWLRPGTSRAFGSLCGIGGGLHNVLHCRGCVSMQCTRFYIYFAAILEYVEKPGAGRLLSDQGRDGGVRLISPAFGLWTFVALLLSGVTFFPVQKQCGILWLEKKKKANSNSCVSTV